MVREELGEFFFDALCSCAHEDDAGVAERAGLWEFLFCEAVVAADESAGFERLSAVVDHRGVAVFALEYGVAVCVCAGDVRGVAAAVEEEDCLGRRGCEDVCYGVFECRADLPEVLWPAWIGARGWWCCVVSYWFCEACAEAFFLGEIDDLYCGESCAADAFGQLPEFVAWVGWFGVGP